MPTFDFCYGMKPIAGSKLFQSTRSLFETPPLPRGKSLFVGMLHGFQVRFAFFRDTPAIAGKNLQLLIPSLIQSPQRLNDLDAHKYNRITKSCQGISARPRIRALSSNPYAKIDPNSPGHSPQELLKFVPTG